MKTHFKMLIINTMDIVENILMFLIFLIITHCNSQNYVNKIYINLISLFDISIIKFGLVCFKYLQYLGVSFLVF